MTLLSRNNIASLQRSHALRIKTSVVELSPFTISIAMSASSAEPHWDSWDLPNDDSDQRSTKVADPANLPHIKESKVNRYLRRSDKHDAFNSLDPDKMLEYIEQS